MSQNAYQCLCSESTDFPGNKTITFDVPLECAIQLYNLYNKILVSADGPLNSFAPISQNIFSSEQIYQDSQDDDDVSIASTITQVSVHSVVLDQDLVFVQEKNTKQKRWTNRCPGEDCRLTGSVFAVDENGTRTGKYHCRGCADKTGLEMKTRIQWNKNYDVKHNNSLASTPSTTTAMLSGIGEFDVFPEENFVFSDNVCMTRGDRRKSGTGCKCKTNTCKGYECNLTGSFFGRSENGVRNTSYYCRKCSYKVPDTVMKNHTQWRKFDDLAQMGF
jgi:hypothetical protein